MAKKWFDSDCYLGDRQKILDKIAFCEKEWKRWNLPISFEGPSGVQLYRVFLQDLRVGNVYFAYEIWRFLRLQREQLQRHGKKMFST